MKHGLPFQGSKSKLAERIVAMLPPAANLYDVMAGGCALTHAALLSGKWGCVHFNDITDSVVLFRDVLEGNVPDGSEWISREEFERRKATDPYVRLVWSFGNNQRDYIYSRKMEPYKKLVHEMLFAPTPDERRLKFRKVCAMMPEVLDWGGVTELPEAAYKLQSCEATPTSPPPVTQRQLQSLAGHPSSESNVRIRRITGGGWRRLRDHESSERSGRIGARPFFGGEYRMTVGDYRDLSILPDSVVYVDPPYRNCRGYGEDEAFDHEAFYDWACALDVPVFISEYWMPEDMFECVAEWERKSTYASQSNSLSKVEKLFIPKK